MPAFSGGVLSGSTNGRPIPVAATGTPGTLIHTVSVTGFQELYIWASNVTLLAEVLTIEFGGVGAPGDHLVTAHSIAAASGPVPIALGQRLSGGLTIRAFVGGVASAINITGGYDAVQ